MRIVCPNCDTAYDAPDSAVAAGRIMRCARCRQEWAPVPLPPKPPFPLDPEPPLHEAPPAAPDIHAPSLAEPELVIHAPIPEPLLAPTGPRKAVIAAWAASLLALILAAWLITTYRQPIIRHFPAAARLLGTGTNRS